MSEPPHAPPPPSGEPPWQPPGVSDEWSPVPSAQTPPRPLPPRPAIVPGPQPQWGSAHWSPAGSVPDGRWPGWVPPPPATTIGGLLQRIFSITLSAPWVFLGLVGLTWIVAAVPLALATFWLVNTEATFDDPSEWATTVAPTAAFVAVIVVQWIVVAGTVSGLAAHPVTRLRSGSRPTLAETMQHARRTLPRLLCWTALLGLAVAAAFTPGIALFGMGATSGGLALIAGSLLLTVIALVPVTWLMVRTAFTAPAIVVDGLSVRDAIGRSGSLSAERFWRTFGVLAVVMVVAWAAMTTVTYPVDILGSIAETWFDDADSGGTATMVSVLGSVVASMIVQPFLAVAPAVLYDDVRAEEASTLGGPPERGNR